MNVPHHQGDGPNENDHAPGSTSADQAGPLQNGPGSPVAATGGDDAGTSPRAAERTGSPVDSDPVIGETARGDDLIDAIALESLVVRPESGSDQVPPHFPSEPGAFEPDSPASVDAGQPIDAYCDQARLTISARLKLFVQVCDLVQAAHEHAIIHGQLTTSTILVTAAGTPRLVGFLRSAPEPSARGLDRGHAPGRPGALAEAAALPACLEYASPEQVKGETVTTATDVYALGVVLYRLLCGRWPYRVTSSSNPDEIIQAICEQVPEPPSAAAVRHLAEQRTAAPTDPGDEQEATAGSPSTRLSEEIAAARGGLTPRDLKRLLAVDLDQIVSKALRKEPEWRYRSVEPFKDDIERYFKGLPLRADPDSLLYRARKFGRRHAAVLAVGGVLLLALIFGLIATTLSLRRARQERDRAELSVRQARRAIDQIVSHVDEDGLVDGLSIDPARQAVLRDTQHFYEDFVKQQGTDPSQRVEVAMAQSRIARIAGQLNPGPEAIAPCERAITLWKDLCAADPGNDDYRMQLVEMLIHLGQALLPLDGRLDEASAAFQRAQEQAEALIAIDSQSVLPRAALGTILLNVAEIERRRDHLEPAIKAVERVLTIESQLVEEIPGSLRFRSTLAAAHALLGRLLAAQPSELIPAVAAFQQAIAARELLVQEHPDSFDQWWHLATELGDLGSLQQKIGQPHLALESLRRTLSIYERISSFYPRVVAYRSGLGQTCNLLSEIQRQRNDPAEALAFAQKAQAQFEPLMADYPDDPSYRRALAKTYHNLGRLLTNTGELPRALRSFQHAVDLIESLSRPDSYDDYNLAINAASCIPLVGAKSSAQLATPPGDLSNGDKLRRKLLGDRALEALRKSARGGLLNSEILQTDTEPRPFTKPPRLPGFRQAD